MKKIKISLNDPKGIERAVAELQAYRSGLQAKAVQLCEALAKVGIPVIENNMKTEGDSNPSCSVTYKTTSNGVRAICTVRASGEDLLFIEFGAGVHYNGQAGSSPHDLGSEFGYTIGGYGLGLGKNDYWHYLGEDGRFHTSHGTKANMPVYKASLEMRSKVISVAKEVFG